MATALATPREISLPPVQLLYREPYPKGRASCAVQLRPWMLSADLMFRTTHTALDTIKRNDFKHKVEAMCNSMATPPWVYSDPYYWRLAWYWMESILVQDPELDALPELEPITDWGWLLTMGLAQ